VQHFKFTKHLINIIAAEISNENAEFTTDPLGVLKNNSKNDDAQHCTRPHLLPVTQQLGGSHLGKRRHGRGSAGARA
jgi:hypothetical protein